MSDLTPEQIIEKLASKRYADSILQETTKVEDITPLEAFRVLLATLKAQKPNDRSDKDRYWAITITEVEKARAVFLTYTK